ncbi:MAG: hypothetical protein IAE97_07495 [Chthoniobacterales bacterium]|nr:hypothetical protein [Chthoniobacterales bacterium]
MSTPAKFARFLGSPRERAYVLAEAKGQKTDKAPEPTDNIIQATEELRAAVGEARQMRELGDRTGWLRNAHGQPTAPSEKYWIDRLAQTGDYIYDPLVDAFFVFSGGLWSRRTRAETRETIDAFIRVEVGEDDTLNLDKLLGKKHLDVLTERLTGHRCVVRRDAFSSPPHGVVLCENGRLQISSEGEIAFAEGNPGERGDMQQVRLPLVYDPSARAERFEGWLSRIFCGREDDTQAVAKMYGAALWGSCRWKKMVVVHGPSNLGKSQIPLITERLIGRQRVAEFETRRLGEKFEMRRFVSKVFLRAEDVDADFMTRGYADVLKQLTGFGSLRVEGKNSHEEFELRGDKIICATSNFRLRVRTDVDRSAWEERLVYLECDGEPYRREEQDTYYVDSLFSNREEAAGILNFALNGLRELLLHGWARSELQMGRVRRVMEQGESVAEFVRGCMTPSGPEEDPARPGTTISEAWACYLEWADTHRAEKWPERIWREMIVEAVEQVRGKTTCNNLPRGGTAQRGWRGITLRRRETKKEEA